MQLTMPWRAMLTCGFHTAVTAIGVSALPQALPLAFKLLAAILIYAAVNKLAPIFDQAQSRLMVSMLPERLHPALNWYLSLVPDRR